MMQTARLAASSWLSNLTQQREQPHSRSRTSAEYPSRRLRHWPCLTLAYRGKAGQRLPLIHGHHSNGRLPATSTPRRFPVSLGVFLDVTPAQSQCQPSRPRGRPPFTRTVSNFGEPMVKASNSSWVCTLGATRITAERDCSSMMHHLVPPY